MTKSPARASAKTASKSYKRFSSIRATAAKAASATFTAAKNQTGDTVSSVAGKVLRGAKATADGVRSMAASLLHQHESKGKRGKKKT